MNTHLNPTCLQQLESTYSTKSFDPHYRSNGGDNALHFACKTNKIEDLKLGLAYGIDPHIENKKLETPLHTAAQKGNKLACELLLKHSPDLANNTDMNGMTPLLHVFKHQDMSLVNLFERYHSFDYKDVPLTYTQEELNKTLNQRPTLSNPADEQNRIDTAKWILSYDVSERREYVYKLFASSCRAGWKAGLEHLVELYGKEVLHDSVNGKKLIHYAVASGNLELIKYLVEQEGFDVNELTTSESSPPSYRHILGERVTLTGSPLKPIYSPLGIAEELCPARKDLINYLIEKGATSYQANGKQVHSIEQHLKL